MSTDPLQEEKSDLNIHPINTENAKILDDTANYLASLNDRELKAYYIAKDHLGMSFTMERSNGFRKWKKEQ